MHLYDIGHFSHNVHQITILKTLFFNYTISNCSIDTYHSCIVVRNKYVLIKKLMLPPQGANTLWVEHTLEYINVILL